MPEQTADRELDLRADHRNIVHQILQHRLPQHEVWAFGSRTRGTAKPYSDLDLAIITSQPLDMGVLAALSDDFSDSELPFKVDMVDWATTGEAFRAIIARDKLVISGHA